MLLDFLRDLDTPRTQKTIRALAGAAQESMMKELGYFGLEVASLSEACPHEQSGTFECRRCIQLGDSATIGSPAIVRRAL
mmetsp:Transcript_18562/g.63880  ORF Transcript_18562/g.63880 Transcript_18562/m.63880 type:complete len:80 (+) Transcript_18562:3-242(+)